MWCTCRLSPQRKLGCVSKVSEETIRIIRKRRKRKINRQKLRLSVLDTVFMTLNYDSRTLCVFESRSYLMYVVQ